MSARRLLSLVLAVAPWGFSVIVFLGSFVWGAGLRCDDHCSPDSPDWHDREDAWQWDLVPVLGGAAAVAGTIFAVCVLLRRRAGAFAALLLGAAATLTAGTLLTPGWHEHLGRNPENVLVCVLVFAAGLLAAGLARDRTG